MKEDDVMGQQDGIKKGLGQRSKKEGTLVSAYIEQKAYDALQRHCEVTGQSKTKAIERAILTYCRGEPAVAPDDGA